MVSDDSTCNCGSNHIVMPPVSFMRGSTAIAPCARASYTFELSTQVRAHVPWGIKLDASLLARHELAVFSNVSSGNVMINVNVLINLYRHARPDRPGRRRVFKSDESFASYRIEPHLFTCRDMRISYENSIFNAVRCTKLAARGS